METTRLLALQTRALVSPALRQITLEVAKVNGLNLGQGVCNLPVPELVRNHVGVAVEGGINRYTNPRGLLSLREALSDKLRRHNGMDADPETEILVTAGATGAFEGVCATLLDPGDEVILFEPSYPYHIQALRRYQATIRTVPLKAPGWAIDFDRVRELLSPRTKFVLVNTPGNPTGKVWTEEELRQLAAILEGTDCLLVTDEIYEYMVFDGRTHRSPASMPELADRTLTIGGYSKTFSITGWRIGYLVAPAPLAAVIASLLDAVYVCAPAPLQEAVAHGILNLDEAFYTGLTRKYQAKRDRFAEGLRGVGIEPIIPEGAYYMMGDFSARFPDLSSHEFAQMLIRETGVGAVPSGDFVRDSETEKWVRFCLAHEDSVLDEAISRLTGLAKKNRVPRSLISTPQIFTLIGRTLSD